MMVYRLNYTFRVYAERNLQIGDVARYSTTGWLKSRQTTRISIFTSALRMPIDDGGLKKMPERHTAGHGLFARNISGALTCHVTESESDSGRSVGRQAWRLASSPSTDSLLVDAVMPFGSVQTTDQQERRRQRTKSSRRRIVN